MAIKKIKVSNFKSFKELDLELGNFNVVIGANASGKSNFTQIFKFLRDIEKEDSLKDAISQNSGIEALRNLKIGPSCDFKIQSVSDKKMGWGRRESRAIIISEATYQLNLKFGKTKRGIKITNDELSLKLAIASLKAKENPNILCEGKLIIRNIEGKPEVSFDPPDLGKKLEDEKIIFPPSAFPKLFGGKIPPNTLLIRTPYSLIPPWETLFKKISIYNIDPHIARKPTSNSGKAELQENGDNLALVLSKIIKDKNKKRKFCNLINDLLPFFDDIGIETFVENSLQIKLKEKYYKNKFLPAHLLSDGTINIAALIIAIYFEEKDIVIIEEPERNIHPHLISKVIDMMKDASTNKQIIVTTHSPEVVKHAGLENILFVSRDKDGFSVIHRLNEKDDLKVFLKTELGIDDLYIQGLLGA